MTATELDALDELVIDWAPVPDDVWRQSQFHVDGIHPQVARAVQRGVIRAKRESGAQLGIVIEGRKGAGKTHLLGWVRNQVQQEDGYFFLVTLHDGVNYWSSVLHCVLEGLLRKGDRTENQLQSFLRRIAAELGMPSTIQDAVAGDMTVPASAMDVLIDAFRAKWPDVGDDWHDALRALVLRASKNVEAIEVGRAYLQAREENEPGERRRWGIGRPDAKSPQWILKEVIGLLALTGPIVVAVDQIDALLTISDSKLTGDAAHSQQAKAVAAGLMDLREQSPRTLLVVACLPTTWTIIDESGVQSASDRFRVVLTLGPLPSADVAMEFVAKRFAPAFASLGYTPPYPTWPVRPEAFRDAAQYFPRRLLQLIDSHINHCLDAGEVVELRSFDESQPDKPPKTTDRAKRSKTGDADDPAALDARFHTLLANADVSAALDAATEDEAMPPLLAAGFGAWIVEQDGKGALYHYDLPPAGTSEIHGRLRLILQDEIEAERHWTFRAIASTNAISALTRLRGADGASGITPGGSARLLIILRNADWAKGTKTKEALERLAASGGRTLQVDPTDLAVFDALLKLRDEKHANLNGWLTSRRPASNTRLLADAFGDGQATLAAGGPSSGPGGPAVVATPSGTAPVASKPATADGAASAAGPTSSIDPASAITVGAMDGNGQPLQIRLDTLRRHVAIFAGSGSGKTVLVRRVVEECALRGISSIVLDPGNDLARLGDAWPTVPSGWGDGDDVRAADYIANTDIVVWTPRQPAGRPLAFQPLPDFGAIKDDPYELQQAIDAAVAMLAPRAKVAGATAAALHKKAVLQQALEYFAEKGHSGLRSFVALLADLPDGVSSMPNADKLAAEMANTLSAEMIVDKLFGGAGAPADPGLLLTPAPGKRARVSVISFIGLPTAELQQSFVNQLQMGLFAWIKKNPAAGPLGGLLVMDEAKTLAPSGPMTACTMSTITLASQARKYGLGLVFATQAPKDLHNQIPGNAVTQIFGHLKSPVQIEAAKAIASATGTPMQDLGSLTTGNFYIGTEGVGFTKVHTPLCLSHHAPSALTEQEVITRAHHGA